MTESRIPLIDLGAQHRQIADEVTEGIHRVMTEACFIDGPDVREFETEFAAFMGTRYCAAVGNGTDSLEFTLRAAGIQPGDEVILPANTFIATALAVARLGATPVIVDCDPEYLLMTAESAEARLAARTRALLPVHLYGQMAPVEDFLALAALKQLAVVEDAAQAQGARRHGSAPGNLGLAAGTSFYPGKNIGAYGDGGAVLTNSQEIYERITALRNYGSRVRNHHPEIGFNSRLDTLQAVVLRAKLSRLTAWNDARRAAAAVYAELLAGVPDVRLPATVPGNEHVYHLYVVRVPHRDYVLSQLQAAGIGASVHYPVPIHLQGAFRYLGHKAGDFPNAERAAGEILSLPMFPQITPAQQARVVEELRNVLARARTECIAL